MYSYFFLSDPATTVIYTLSLHDALPISLVDPMKMNGCALVVANAPPALEAPLREAGAWIVGAAGEKGGETRIWRLRSDEHTSELQSRRDLVCRLLLEKKNDRLRKSLYCA